jgi:spore coat polysaccharide biosynthesis protein SpsF (cytidylyltransferase family)
MNLGVIIDCRMNVSSLPGQALVDICGEPLLTRLLQRLDLLRDSFTSEQPRVIVATSRSWHDDAVERYCQEQRIDCYRGSLNHVADRLSKCAAQFQLDWFAWVTANSPFVDVGLLQQAFDMSAEPNFDFITNLAPPSYPAGVSVECIRTGWFQWVRAYQPLLIDPQHVSNRFYNNLHQLRYFNIQRTSESYDPDTTHCQLTVDTQDDLDWFRSFYATHSAEWPEIDFAVAVQDRLPLKRIA